MQTLKCFENLNILFLAPFGSTLYGTEITIDDLTEEEKLNSDNYLSDKDFKGIYLPTKEEIYYNKIPKSIKFDSKDNPNMKNKPEDIDCELYSLQHFLKMALDGDTAAMDMLHCPEELWIKTSSVWEKMVKNRSRFYTKNLKTLVDYARGQAAKYGVKGSRLSDAKNVLDFLNKFDPKNNNPKLREIWDQLPTGEHIFKLSPDIKTGLRMYEVCNRKSQETAKACYCRDMVQRFYDDYGDRAKKAARNEGVDWKAISHAVRAGFQLKEIILNGTITFPLADREFIKKVKLGRFSYFCMAIYLDCMVDELEELNRNSSLPINPDYDFWINFLISEIDIKYN